MRTKPAALCLAALLLAGCVDSGTGGYQLDAYALNGTSTAIAAVATNTAVSANQTRQAAEYVANANGTATAVQVTATAAAIGTAKAQITNAEAIAILERAQMEQEAARPGMTATAVYLMENSAYDSTQLQRRLENDITRAAMRHKVITGFWVIIGLGCVVGLYAAVTYINAYGKERRVRRERLRTRPEVIENESGQVLAITDEFKMVPPRQVTVIEQRQPREQGATPQTIMAQRPGGYSKEGALPAPNSTERQNINAWLISVNQGLSAFNRTGADTYRIGHERADSVIDLALKMGYASKEEGRTNPVLPRDNFEQFINQLVSNSPHSNMPAAQNASPG